MLTLVEKGAVFAPEVLGIQSVLLAGSKIESVGEIPADSLRRASLDVDIIDATGCFVTPGFIDPHQHILGGSGEKGFSSQTPEIHASEIIGAGVTTVVGCLGVDTTM